MRAGRLGRLAIDGGRGKPHAGLGTVLKPGQQAAVARNHVGAPHSMAPELRFIIDFCGPSREHAAASPLDWTLVALGLERHGLTRLIPQMLAMPGLVPGDVQGVLREMAQDHAAAGLAQVRETIRICALLEQANVRFLLIKGVALSIQLYGRAGVRGSKDIDILVEPGSEARVDAALRSLGYARPDGDHAKDDVPGYVAKEIGYLDRERGMMVEVHSRLTENAQLYVADFEALWKSRETVTVGDRTLPTLRRELLATYLCAHGARHCWARLMWLLDIAPLTDTPQAIEAALADARRCGLEPVLLHALWLLHFWFGHDVPQPVIARARSSRAARMLNRMTEILHADRRWYAKPPRRSWRRFFQNSLLGRIVSYTMKAEPAYWRGQLALDLISPADRTIIALPPRFVWAYAALRPFGWLIRRVRG